MATTTNGPTPEQAIEQALEQAKLVARMYAEAEQLLAEKIAKHATGGGDERDAGQWQEQRFAEIGQLRKEAQQIIKRLESVAKKAAEKAVLQSWANGMDSAVVSALSQVHDDKVRKRLGRVLRDARNLGAKKLINPGQGVNELARQTIEKLSAVHLSALRVVDDIYRKVIADTAGQVLTGARTRKEAARDALKRLTPVAPFRDKLGRQWRMSTYVDMALRTATARAAVDGHLTVMKDAGIDLVMVSTTPWRCPECDPWEGKILTQSGSPGTLTMEHAVEDGVQVEVNVAATVAAARLAGLLHPNCRHSLGAYLPGVTKAPAKVTAPAPKKKLTKKTAAAVAGRSAPSATSRTSSMRDAVRHRTNEEAARWAKANMPSLRLTEEEFRAVRSYTGPGFVPMNAALRSPSATRDGWVEEQIRNCDRAIARQSIPESVILHRGVGRGYADFHGVDIDSPIQMKGLVGRVINDDAYLSTSIGKSAAFAIKDIRMMIKVPKGHHALHVQEMSQYKSEREILLRRNTRYIVHAVYMKGGQWYMEVEVVPDDWTKPASWAPDPLNDADLGYR